MNSWMIFFLIPLSVGVTNTKTLNCNYTQKFENYKCTISDQEVPLNDEIVLDSRDNGNLFTSNHEVKEILMENLNISYVPNQIFKIFPNVEILSLEQIALKGWSKEYLEGANKLEKLIIWSSLIEDFEDGAFAEAPQLSSLSIWMSQMKTISPGMFQNLTNLIEVDLRHNNNFIFLLDNAFDFITSTVSYINLSRTDLEKVPTGIFKKCRKLVEVDLTENNLVPINASETFPESLKKLSICKFLASFCDDSLLKLT